MIVERDSQALWALAQRLRLAGYDVEEVGTSDAAMDALDRGMDVIVLGHLGADDSAAVMARARARDIDMAVLLVTPESAETDLGHARFAATEVIQQPFVLDDLMRRIAREAAISRIRRALHAWQASHPVVHRIESIIGESDAIARVRALVGKMTGSAGVAALISGEPGSGHAFIARVVHETSERSEGGFLRVNCAARREADLEAELFGVDDAPKRVAGAFELADEGTVLLEAVEQMPASMQAVLLRVLEHRTIRRQGGHVDVPTGARIIASAGADLDAEVEAGRFRRDLYYRLAVVRLDLPPLRRRDRDVVLLAAYFAEVEGRRWRHVPAYLDAGAESVLLSYDWPGNVTELRNVVERAVMLSTGDRLTRGILESVIGAPRGTSAAADNAGVVLPPDGLDLDSIERSLVIQALERTGGNQTRAAKLLGLNRDQIRYRMQKYGLRV